MTEDEIKIEAEEKPEQENLEDADLDTTGITIHSDVVDPEVSQVAGPYDANQIRAVKEAYFSLSAGDRSRLNPDLYQRMIRSVTAYENAVRQVRIAVREGSQLSIDRFNGRLLNVETTAQLSGKVTLVSVIVELELYIDPSAPEQYKNEGMLTYRLTSPGGQELDENDEVPDGSVISVMYNETLLDSLVISIE